jgi:hypothetical protein
MSLVWMALARDYVKKQLDDRTATNYDLVSVIVMKEDADVPLILEPIDWVLYNKLVDMREWTELRPSGPGNYVHAGSRGSRASLVIQPEQFLFALPHVLFRRKTVRQGSLFRTHGQDSCQVRSSTHGMLYWHGR